jgi:ankyrin repeat protein
MNLDRLGPLYQACFRGDFDEARTLLLEGRVDPNSTDFEGNTVLHHMAAKGNFKLVRLLINNGADVHFVNMYDEIPLHAAASMPQSNTSVAQFLLERGSNPIFMRNYAETPLHCACFCGHLGIVELMLKNLKNKRDIRIQCMYGRTPLHDAAMHGNVEVVKLLLKKGASVDDLTNDRRTALHYACAKGNIKVAILLLDNGAKPTLDMDGLSPFELAIMFGYAEEFSKLKSKRAEIALSYSFVSELSQTSSLKSGSSASTNDNIKWLCPHCKLKPISRALAECLHAFCETCAENLSKCPRCNRLNKERILVVLKYIIKGAYFIMV